MHVVVDIGHVMIMSRQSSPDSSKHRLELPGIIALGGKTCKDGPGISLLILFLVS